MKPQKYPHSKIKKGIILYCYDAFSYDDGTSTVELQEWHVRSIMRKPRTQTRFGRPNPYAEFHQTIYIYVTRKVKDITWGKKSRKNGDFGWLGSISEYYRKSFRVGSDLPTGLYTTKLSALKYAVHEKLESIKRLKKYAKEETDLEEIKEWNECIESDEKELKLLKSRLTRLKNSK